MSQIPISDVIVVLPGIMGSVLALEGRDVWNLSGGAVFRAITGRLGDVLKLELTSDPTDEDRVDDVTVTGLLEDTTIIPGFWKVDGYTKLRKGLLQRFTLTPGENYFEFPYDWRRNNKVHARRLQRESAEWLRRWREKTGNPNARLIILAHSMGGLISRYFLENLEGWRDTRILVTFGTPNLGAVNAMKTLCDGVKMNAGSVSLFDITKMARSCTAIYELLPVFPCLDPGDGKLVRLVETAAHGLDSAKVQAARDFHREIEDAYQANLRDEHYRREGYDFTAIVGTHQSTLQSVLQASGVLSFLTQRSGRDDSGDGTVPRISATPPASKIREVFIAECHGSLQNSDFALLQVEGIITRAASGAGSADLLSFTEDEMGTPVSLRIEDAYSAADPVTFAARPEREGAALGAVITPTEGGEALLVPMRLDQDGWYRGEVAKLPVGMYRIKVGGEAASPVTDVFLVA